MQTVDKRLITLIWYAGALTLSDSFAWKNRIKVLRRINPAGAGYVSYDPTRPANSLTVVNTGDVLTLDATGIVASDSSTFFQVDNGTPPANRDPSDTMRFEVPAGGTRTIDYAPIRFSKKAYPLFSSGQDLVTFSVNGGAFVGYFTASQQIDALPASDFGSNGRGFTMQPRVSALTSADNLTIDYLIST